MTGMIIKMEFPLSQMLLALPWKMFLRRPKGIKNIPKDKGFIIASNHCSYMDHLLISGVFIPYMKKRVRFLAKKEHFEGFFQKAWHEWTGAIPIDRQAGGKKALKEAIKQLRKREVIGIYPEGTRSLTGKIQQGKTGAARLALAAKVPVLPVGLIGTFDIMPKGKNIPKLKRADMNIGKQMYFDKYYGQEDNKKVIRRVTDSIMKEIAKLSKQKYKF